jgi:predicted RNase H-like HicB family nuclease
MKRYPVIIEKDTDTGLLVGYIPNVAGAHSQGRTLEELRTNLREVIDMLLEDGALQEQSELVAVEQMIA